MLVSYDKTTNASKQVSKMSSGSIEMSVMEQASGLCAEASIHSPLLSLPAATRKTKLPQ